MVAGGYATVTDGRYAPVEDTLGILRGGAILDVRAIVELLVPLGALLPRVQAAIRDGGGIRSAEFQDALGMTAERVNVPMYDRLLLWSGSRVTRIFMRRSSAGSTPRRSGQVAGPPSGSWPGGFPPPGSSVSTSIRRPLRKRTRARPRRAWPTSGLKPSTQASLPEGAFDVVCMFDAFHHMTDRDAVLVGIRASLRPGGSLLLAEAAVSGDAATDAADPTAALVYGSDLIYCFQESKVAGRSGLGATWPGRGLTNMLARNGSSPRLGVWNWRPATW